MGEWLLTKHRCATPADGALKMCEEVGEVAAALNKGHDRQRLADELADVIIATHSTAMLAGIDLDDVVPDRWADVRTRP